jgi:hypothetical protein
MRYADAAAWNGPILQRHQRWLTDPARIGEVKARQVDGLSVTGFSATRDFGPFFGFVARSPAAATVIVPDLLSRN